MSRNRFAGTARRHIRRCCGYRLIASIAFIIHLGVYADCGLFDKIFKNDIKKTMLVEEQEQMMVNTHGNAASLAVELSKLDQQLEERRHREGREDAFTHLMAKAQEQAEGYNYESLLNHPLPESKEQHISTTDQIRRGTLKIPINGQSPQPAEEVGADGCDEGYDSPSEQYSTQNRRLVGESVKEQKSNSLTMPSFFKKVNQAS